MKNNLAGQRVIVWNDTHCVTGMIRKFTTIVPGVVTVFSS